jgi:hypothetical protein
VMVVVLTATWVPFAAVGEVVVVVGDVGTDVVLAIFAAGDWVAILAAGDWPAIFAAGDWPAIFAAGDWVAALPVPRDAMFPVKRIDFNNTIEKGFEDR